MLMYVCHRVMHTCVTFAHPLFTAQEEARGKAGSVGSVQARVIHAREQLAAAQARVSAQEEVINTEQARLEAWVSWRVGSTVSMACPGM
jgi:hypothetical protein